MCECIVSVQVYCVSVSAWCQCESMVSVRVDGVSVSAWYPCECIVLVRMYGVWYQCKRVESVQVHGQTVCVLPVSDAGMHCVSGCYAEIPASSRSRTRDKLREK